jgi:CBS domain-containing protein
MQTTTLAHRDAGGWEPSTASQAVIRLRFEGPKSGHRMAAKRLQFPWRLDRSTIFSNLKVTWRICQTEDDPMPGRLVSDLMSGNVYSLPGSASVLEAARLMSDCHIGAVLGHVPIKGIPESAAF